MNYEVTWLPVAGVSLTVIWKNHPDPAAVARAAYELERILAAEGPTAGESRPGNRRIALEPPLAVLFQVDGDTVSVIRVWSYA